MNSSLVSEVTDSSVVADVILDGPKKRNKGKNYKFHSDYPDEETARGCITHEDGFEGYYWRYHRITSHSRGTTHWYRCVESLSCPMVQMKVDTIEDLTVILVGTDQHEHDTASDSTQDSSSKHGIDPKLKPFIDEYERMGLKPATMLISLREKASHLPTVIQLNNYLKRLRNSRTGNLGSRISLNDILDFYNEHKEVPEDMDQMFVVDCYCEASEIENEINYKFRIFLTTKRLIEFTKYVNYLQF